MWVALVGCSTGCGSMRDGAYRNCAEGLRGEGGVRRAELERLARRGLAARKALVAQLASSFQILLVPLPVVWLDAGEGEQIREHALLELEVEWAVDCEGRGEVDLEEPRFEGVVD